MPLNGKIPMRLSVINGSNTNLNSIDEQGALTSLMNILENKKQTLSNWIEVVTSNYDYRLKLLEKLKAMGIKVKNPNWKVIKVKKNGDLVI